MLTHGNLFSTFLKLTHDDKYGYESCGYLPFLLHAKWEHDTGVAGAVDFTGDDASIIQQIRDRYHNQEILSPYKKEKVLLPCENLSKESIFFHNLVVDQDKQESHSDVNLHYVISTIQALDLSPKNLKQEDLTEIINDYLTRVDIFATRPYIRDSDGIFSAQEVISILAGDVEEAYDPFSGYGTALSLVNAKEVRGSDPSVIRTLLAKIRMDFMGIKSSFNPVSSLELPEIGSDGTARKSELVISSLSSILAGDVLSAVSENAYGRFTNLIPQRKTEDDDEYATKCILGAALGQALACTKERCILYMHAPIQSNPSLLMNSDPANIKQFISSDYLEGVIQIKSHDADEVTVINIINKNKDERHQGRIFFMFVTDEKMTARDIARIYEECEEIPEVSRFVDNTDIDITNRRYCLSAVRYTATLRGPETADTATIMRNIRRLDERNNSLMTDIMGVADSLIQLRHRKEKE